MPHQCVRCNTFYEDGAKEILQGYSCGSKLFFYVKKSQMDKSQQLTSSLSEDEKKQIEKDIYDLAGLSEGSEPVVLDLESVRIQKPGKYELDLVHLFKKQPLVYKMGDGRYVIDLPETFKKELKRHRDEHSGSS